MIKFLNIWPSYSLCFLILLLACGCNYSSPKVGAQRNNATAIIHYQNSVYPYVRNHCQSCHGVDQEPLIAVEDIDISYQEIKPYVNFQSPEDSALLKRATNGHCGTACTQDGETLLGAIQHWAQTESPNPTKPVLKATQSILFPDITSDPVVVKWTLDSEGFVGSSIELTLNRFRAGYVSLTLPRIHAGEEPLRIGNIGVLIDGLQISNGFADVDTEVGALSHVLLSSKTLIAPVGRKLQLQFANLEVSSSVDCRAFDYYRLNIHNSILVTCKKCHLNQNGSFVNYNSIVMCRNLLEMISRGSDVTQSVLLSFPLFSRFGHPKVPLDEWELTHLRNWISLEHSSL